MVLDWLPSDFVGCNWNDKAFCVLEEEENRQGDEQDGRGDKPLHGGLKKILNSYSHSALTASDPDHSSTNMEPMLLHSVALTFSIFMPFIHPSILIIIIISPCCYIQ